MTLAYRHVHDGSSKRPVALVVVCGYCGSREVGYAFYDGPTLWWWRTYTTPIPARRRDGWLRNTAGRGRSHTIGGPDYGPVEVDVAGGPHPWVARCPRHGDVVTPELDPAALSPTSTRRIRATVSTAQ